MQTTDEEYAKEDEGGEALEAKHVYILLKKEYRISRNVRAEWYFQRINSIITVPKRDKLSEYEEELEVVSVIPVDVPPEWDSDTSHLYKYRVTQQTTLHFLARKYRLVFCLDLSPSTSIVDVTKGSVVLDEVYTTLRQCLKGIVRPFYVPGSQLLFQPKVYLTIIAHTPFFKSQSQQVLVQGWLLMIHNLDAFLDNIHAKLTMLEAQLAQATAQTYGQMDVARERCEIAREKVTGMLFDESVDMGPTTVTNPMVSPDIGFVDMLRYGIVALQLLPENSSAGIVVITDGVISLPDATSFDTLLVQLRNQTISCSFLQLGSVYHPQASLGFVPFSDLMHFLALATCGAYLATLPSIEEDYIYDMNEYHKALLSWGFQKFMHGLTPENDYYGTNRFFHLQPIAQEATELMRKKERVSQLNTSLNAVLSCRLREGYTIKEVIISDDQIQLMLVLPWKYSIFIEYHMKAAWPPTLSTVYTEVWIEATYEFLNDVTNDVNHQFRSKYRQRMVAKYFSTLEHLKDTDALLVELQSFASNQVYFTIPDCVKSGYPVFYLNPGQSHPISAAASDQFPQFATFWKRVCVLDLSIWQKWMHTHRIGVFLEHDHPLSKNLHITNASGRYGIVQCRQAELALTTLLSEWCDFVLVENHSYVKFLYKEDDQEKPPTSFFVVRITSKPPPCIVIRLAFLGGTPGNIRNQIVKHLSERIQGLTFPSRMGLSDRSKALTSSTHQSQEKLNESVGSTLSPSTDLRSSGLRPVLTRVASNIPCCVITHKPIEKILIWYEKVPSNLLCNIVQENPINPTKSVSAKLGATKSATNNLALLSRYLHHRRWIWTVQAPNAPAVSLNAVARVLNTLARIRLQEGFNFAYSCNGIITMVREFDMKLELRESDDNGLLESNIEGGLETFPCVAQYVIFPPHVTNSTRDSTVDEDWEEGDSVEADGELQVVTECWVEPQNGAVISPSPHALHFHNCNYRQMAQAFFPIDQECIWGLLTFEHLLSMCQSGGSNYNLIPPGGGGATTATALGGGLDYQLSLPPVTTTIEPPRITQVPFSFDLIRLLPKCQQVELLVSTYIQDVYSCLVKRVTFGGENTTDEANQILFGMLLDHILQLHDNQEFPLSNADHRALPRMLQGRQRSHTVSPSPFSNTYISETCDPPKWRCFLKGVTPNHLIITLLPASYHDLKLLLVKRANLSDSKNMAFKVIPDSENTLDLDTETNTTDQPAGGPMSEQQVSFESSTSSLTHLTSPSLPPPTPTNNKSACVSVEEAESLTPRMRYRSGPVATTQSQPVYPVFSDSVLRERASSFHVSRERCSSFGQSSLAPERNRTGSVDSPTKDPQSSDLHITESPKDHVRKRYISMPSKSYPGFIDPSMKSISNEALKNEEGCVPLHMRNTGGAEVDSMGRVPSAEDSQSAVPPSPCNKFLFGAVTLPIYVYDCKLNSIITQLVNREERSCVVGKDIYMDSTFKLESEPMEDTVPLKGEELLPLSGLPDENKHPSPEPRSEESDVGADSSFLRSHVTAVEECYLRSFVLSVFQSLQKELMIHTHDMEAALNHCHESVMEIDITHFLQTICGHLRDFRLRSNFEQMHQSQTRIPKSPQAPQRQMAEKNKVDQQLPSRPKSATSSRFPLSLLKQHLPCRDLQQLHSLIRDRFSGILQGSFRLVPSLPEFYFFSPQSLHRSSEGTPVGDFIYVSSRDLEEWDQAPHIPMRQRKLRRVSVSKRCDAFTEGEEELEDETTINGCEEEEELGEEEEEEDHDKSIEFRSDIGSSVYRRLHSHLTSIEGDEDKTSVISERDEDLSTIPDNIDFMDGLVPPLFLHLTCTVRLAGHEQSTMSVKTVPTCLDEIVYCLSSSEVDLSTVNVTLDVLCMTLPPALATKTTGETIASLPGRRSFRTTSFCSSSSPQLKRGRSVSESMCASLSDMDEPYLEEDDQLGHLPNYQHQAVVSTVDEIKWLVRDEIASSMLHIYPLTEQTLEMVAAHVESSRHVGNCISESVPLNFVCGMEQSRDKFIQEFGRLSVAGHHLEQEGSLYYLVLDKNQMRRRHFSSLVPPLGFKSQFLIVRPQPHADDAAQLRQMESGNVANKVIMSSPDVKLPAKLNPTRVSFDSERRTSECLGDNENLGQRGEKWMRRRERKERRDSERRGSINSTDSDSEINQGRSPYSRESSYQSYDGRTRFSESPKKGSDMSLVSSKKAIERNEGNEDVHDEEEHKEVKRHPPLIRSGPCLTPSLCESEYPIELQKDNIYVDEDYEQKDKARSNASELGTEKNNVENLLSEAPLIEGENLNGESKETLEKDLIKETSELQNSTEGKLDTSKVIKDDSLTEEASVIVETTANTSSQSEELVGIEPPRTVKEVTQGLALPLNELIRCGSESLPRTQVSTEVIRKSASTDNFVPSVTEAAMETLRMTNSNVMVPSGSNCGLWAELVKSRHSSSELKSRHNSGASADLLKSRHNSGAGGDLLKSRHNSGTGSVPGGLYSDVSSLLESGQTTEDGCEGDISDSDNECCDWLQDFESVRPFLPEFWFILRVSKDRVCTFFHCRSEGEVSRWRGIQSEVVRSIRSLVKLVNQTLLLQDLHATRMCNPLLEPETSDDIWRHEETKGRNIEDGDPEYRGVLEASLKFKAGAFACRVVWETKFELHPKVKLCAGKVGSKGIQALRTILNPISVNNRKNMFVYEDSSGNGPHVFYLRLNEQQTTSVSPQVDGRRDDSGLSHSSSVVSLGKRGSRDDDPIILKNELRPRVSSFGEKDVIMEGVPSTPAQRKRNHYIILTVHGIAEPGPAIKEELVRMLQNRLDEAVVEAICVMLWSNPQHKLTPEDVHFIQPPYQPPKTTLRFTVNAYALPHLQAVGYFLKQNMLSCGFIQPKFADGRPEHRFQDFSATDQDLCNEPNIFLFVRPRKSAAKGIACIAFSLVDGTGNVVQHISCQRPCHHAYQEVFSKQEFDALTHTEEYQQSPTKSPGPMAMLQFKVWESGRVDLNEVRRYLMDSISHALYDVNMEYRLLTAPLIPFQEKQHYTAPASEPSTPKKDTRGEAVQSVSLLERSPNKTEDRMRSISVSGVPPHICLPHMTNRLGIKRTVHNSDNRGDMLRDQRAPSPLSLVQSDGAAPVSSAHSPLKVRHSVDLGMEHSKLLNEDGLGASSEGAPWDAVDRSSATLHPVFSELMLDWLEYASELDEKGEHAIRKEPGEKGGEHAVRKHTQYISTRHAIPVFITELQKWVSQNCGDIVTEIFEETDSDGKSPVYKLMESGKPPNMLKPSVEGGYECKNIIIIGRNNKQWWASMSEDNIQEHYITVIKPSKNSQRYPPLIVSPRGRCFSDEETRVDSGGTTSGLSTPVTAPASTSASLLSGGTSVSGTAIPISAPVTVPSTPTSFTSAVLWRHEASEFLFIPRQKLLYATIFGQELVIYTYNWTKEQCDSLHFTMNRLAQWSKARARLLSTIVLQKAGLFHNQPFVRKDPDDEDSPNVFTSGPIENLIKAQAPSSNLSGVTDRTSRRGQPGVQIPGIGDVYRDSKPSRCLRNSANGNLKVLEMRHGNQMLEIRYQRSQKEKQKKELIQTILTPGHSSPAFDEKILGLYKQTARFSHFCYTPMLFLPRWRWQVAAIRDHSLPHEELSAERATIIGFKTPENRSRHDSGNSLKGVGTTGPAELRRTLSLKTTAVSSPGQRKRHMTGGDDKWHGTLCSNYLKEYIQYLQSLGFLSIPVTKGPHQKGLNHSREREMRTFRMKEVRFNEQLSTEPTYLLKNVLGGTILLEIFFTEPYFSVKVYVLEASRLHGKKFSSLSSQFAINYFLDEVDNMKVFLHVHSFTYDFHLRIVCAYVTDRQLLFSPGYHLSSLLNDFIKYYNKGPNFARNMIYSAKMKVLDTGTPGEQLYNYLLAREKQYGVKVLRMKPIMIDPDSDMHQTEFIMVYNKTCKMGYSDANEQRVTDDYDVSVLVTHEHSEDGDLADQQTDALHLKVYIILSSKREMYPNRTLEKKKGIFKTVFDVPTLKAEDAAPSTLKTEEVEKKGEVTDGVPAASSVIEDGKELSSSFSEWTKSSIVTEEASPVLEYIPSLPNAKEDPAPPPLRSHSGIRLESVKYLGYYTHYEQKIHSILHTQALQAQTHIHFIFNQAKIHCRRDWLWQRVTAVLREDERQKISRDQVLSITAYSELCELLSLVQVTSLSTFDSNLAPFFSKPLQWYQSLTRVLQTKYQDRYRSLTSSDGNIQHLLILSPSCPEAFMMLSTNLHLQKAELSCINKQLRNEDKVVLVTNNRIMGILKDFVNACCYHLWTGLL